MSKISNEQLMTDAKERYDILLGQLKVAERILAESELTTESRANGTITHPNFKNYESLLKQFNTLCRTISNLNSESGIKQSGKPSNALAEFANSKRK